MEKVDRYTSANVIDPRVRTVVDHIVAEARPLRVILFGSHATGNARSDSDIDLLVVMPVGIDRRAVMEEIGSRMPRPGIGVDLLVATPATLREHADNPGLIYRQILSTGREVYVSSDRTSLRGDGALTFREEQGVHSPVFSMHGATSLWRKLRLRRVYSLKR